jgi:Mg-chelatase subunit ChlD
MTPETERLRRWRLLLGSSAEDSCGACSGADQRLDVSLEMLYGDGDSSQMTSEDKEKNRNNVGKGKSQPKVARWLSDIREFFPSSVVQVMQRDAFERLGLKRMLLEPEMMEAVTPDVHMVSTLLALKNIMPQKAKDTARIIVQHVVSELERKLSEKTRQAVTGSLNRAIRNRRPKHTEMDWNRTIRANLKHYQPDYKSIVPETRIGYGRKKSSLRDIILCLDQSGSMGSSVVYAGVFGAVLASLPAVRTRVVVYDTSVVDLTAELHDPVDVLFGTQLGGGNDTPRALDYCASLLEKPQDTIFILISDLYEGGGSAAMLQKLEAFVASGVTVISLLALSDDGKPSYDTQNGAALANMGVPVFACTPDLFPDLMAAAIQRRDLGAWAASEGIVTAQKSA